MPVDAGHADAVIADRANGPCNVGAMPFLIHWIAVIVDGRVAVDVVNNAVVIVIDAITGHFTGVHPDIVF